MREDELFLAIPFFVWFCCDKFRSRRVFLNDPIDIEFDMEISDNADYHLRIISKYDLTI